LADALMDDYRRAPIDPAMKQLLAFAEKVAHEPGAMTPDDIAELRLAGFSDRAVLDAAHVAGFFSYMNRVVQALGADGKAGIAATAEKAAGPYPSAAPSPI
jgi:uncharacterized peroxidase-related enzyme